VAARRILKAPRCQTESIMSKSIDSKKETKKKPALTMKEKKAVKKEKKASK
jgi:hypothetical protein